MKGFGHYINGSYISSSHHSTGSTLYWNNEPTEYRFSKILNSCSDDQELIEAALQGSFETHQQGLDGFFPLEERKCFLEQLYREIEKYIESTARVLSYEVSKPIQLARTEIDRALLTLKNTLESADLFFQQKELLNSKLKKGSCFRQGLGPVLCLTPYNFPINLALHKIAPAILSGCPVVLISSPKAVLSTACLVDQIHAAKLPPGMLNFLHCDFESIEKIAQDPRIRLISFTGSSEVGWKLSHLAGDKSVTLELGGTAPVYIDPSSDIELGAQEVAQSAFTYAGQVCISAQNVYVHSEIYESFKQKLFKAIEQFPTGAIDDPTSLCSGVVDQVNYQRIQALLEDEKEHIIYQGESKEIPNFITPTVLEGPSKHFYQNEVFAPILSLSKVDNFESWTKLVQKQKYRLQCSVFTEDEEQKKVARKLDFGGIIINKAPSVRLDSMPYGGQGKSGLLREGPLYALEFMNTWKSVLEF